MVQVNSSHQHLIEEIEATDALTLDAIDCTVEIRHDAEGYQVEVSNDYTLSNWILRFPSATEAAEFAAHWLVPEQPSENEVIGQLRAFRDARDWARFHTPKNLAMALAAEAGELLALFQWQTPEESEHVVEADAMEHVESEIADVATYLLLLADRLGISVLNQVQAKLRLNEERYPVHLSRGNATKYTQLTEAPENS